MAKNITVLGHEVSFERRRYGTTTYTWAYVKIGDEEICLDDPWPCISPKITELECAIKAKLRTPEESAALKAQFDHETAH